MCKDDYALLIPYPPQKKIKVFLINLSLIYQEVWTENVAASSWRSNTK